MTIQDIYQTPALYAEYIQFENNYFFNNKFANYIEEDLDGIEAQIAKERWIQNNVMTLFIQSKTQA